MSNSATEDCRLTKRIAFLAAAPASRFDRRNSFRGARVAAGCVLTGFTIGALLFGLLA
jgi:hypothetical protein